jgi:hypothetical protein
LVGGIIEIQDGLVVIKINRFWGRILAFKSKIAIPLVAIDDIITDPLIITRTISGSFRILGTSFGNYHGGTFYKKGRGMAFFSFRRIDRSIMLTMKGFYKYKIIVIEVQDKEKTYSIIRKAIGNSREYGCVR